ncbi:MAG: hypothetical protein HQK54_11520 [Oligoflexales bacterium]|nr:hypothetical protein [Oligoflexales bacterium]
MIQSIFKIKNLLELVVITICFSLSNSVFGIVEPNLKNKTASENKIEPFDSTDAGAVRVRIPLKMITYEKVIVQKPNGESRLENKKSQVIRYTIRGRIERANHFYVGRWHIETIPLSWAQKTKKYKTKLRFYKIYGDSPELEEYLGNVIASGQLEGDNRLYNLIGFAGSSFNDKNNNPVLDVEVGAALTQEKSPLISRGQQQ